MKQCEKIGVSPPWRNLLARDYKNAMRDKQMVHNTQRNRKPPPLPHPLPHPLFCFGKRLGCGPIRRLSFHICLFCLLALLELVIVVCICMLGHFDPWCWFFSSLNPRTITRKWEITLFASSKGTFLITKKYWGALFFRSIFFVSEAPGALRFGALDPHVELGLDAFTSFFFPFTHFVNLQQVARFFCFWFCVVVWSVRILSRTLNCVFVSFVVNFQIPSGGRSSTANQYLWGLTKDRCRLWGQK